MAKLPHNIRDREHSVFTLCNGEPAKRVCVSNGANEPIPVVQVKNLAGTPIIEYNEINALAGLTSADVLTYTVPIDKSLCSFQINFSGENKAVFEIKLNGSTIAKKRTWFTKFDDSISFPVLKLSPGDIIKVEVYNSTNSIADFNATLEGVLYES